MSDRKDIKLPAIGSKLVVAGILPPAQVISVEYKPDQDRYCITLDWGIRGRSQVYSTDENKVWYKYNQSN